MNTDSKTENALLWLTNELANLQSKVGMINGENEGMNRSDYFGQNQAEMLKNLYLVLGKFDVAEAKPIQPPQSLVTKIEIILDAYGAAIVKRDINDHTFIHPEKYIKDILELFKPIMEVYGTDRTCDALFSDRKWLLDNSANAPQITPVVKNNSLIINEICYRMWQAIETVVCQKTQGDKE
jgi:hypothetical protein